MLKTIDDFRDRRQRDRVAEARRAVITEHVEKEKKRAPPRIRSPKAKPEKSDREET